MGFRWSVNPYRGCVHGCHYCFARRYHTYLDLGAGEDFTGVILVKVNAVAVLRAELSRRELAARDGGGGYGDRSLSADRGTLPPDARDPRGPRRCADAGERDHEGPDGDPGPRRAGRRARPRRRVRVREPHDARSGSLAAARARHGAAAPATPGGGGARGGRHPRRRAARADRARADDRPRESRGGRPRGGGARRRVFSGRGCFISRPACASTSTAFFPRRRRPCFRSTGACTREPGARRRRAKPPVDRGRPSPPLPSQRSSSAGDGSERPTTREWGPRGEQRPADPEPVSRRGPYGFLPTTTVSPLSTTSMPTILETSHFISPPTSFLTPVLL